MQVKLCLNMHTHFEGGLTQGRPHTCAHRQHNESACICAVMLLSSSLSLLGLVSPPLGSFKWQSVGGLGGRMGDANVVWDGLGLCRTAWAGELWISKAEAPMFVVLVCLGQRCPTRPAPGFGTIFGRTGPEAAPQGPRRLENKINSAPEPSSNSRSGSFVAATQEFGLEKSQRQHAHRTAEGPPRSASLPSVTGHKMLLYTVRRSRIFIKFDA